MYCCYAPGSCTKLGALLPTERSSRRAGCVRHQVHDPDCVRSKLEIQIRYIVIGAQERVSPRVTACLQFDWRGCIHGCQTGSEFGSCSDDSSGGVTRLRSDVGARGSRRLGVALCTRTVRVAALPGALRVAVACNACYEFPQSFRLFPTLSLLSHKHT